MTRIYDRKRQRFVDESTAVNDSLTQLGIDVADLQNHHYEAVVLGGFNEDVIYQTGDQKLPIFITTTAGDVVFSRETNAA